MIEKVIRTIQKYNMISKGDKIVVSVSGGPDSIALLHILNKLKQKYDIQIIAAHVNHNLRGRESDNDQKFVENVCKDWNIPIFVQSADIIKISKEHKISLEVAGREYRYKFLNKIVQQENVQKIAVAHNFNDNAETILMRIIRGTGSEGLSGINSVRDNIIRPLIEIDRSQIELYCSINNLNPRIDSSNLESIYTRNKIRLQLIPYLEREFNPNIISTLNRMGELISLENKYINNQAQKILSNLILEKSEEYITLNLDKINKQDNLIISRVLRFVIKEFLGSLKDIEQKNILDAMSFIKNSKTGSIFNLPKGVKLKKSYDTLQISKESKMQDSIKYNYEIKIPGETRINETGHVIRAEIKSIKDINVKTDKYIQTFDLDKLDGDLVLRTRNNGDIFSPSGMTGKKKLKDYFIDKKIPRDKRDSIPLVAKDNEIVWIIGDRISEKYKADNNTKFKLILEYITS